MREISTDEAALQHGVSTSHHQMDNGELRFRLKKKDGTAYIRTEAGSTGAWQQSHFHKQVRETYIVQSGWIAYATQNQTGQFDIEIFGENELFTTRPRLIHNVYMAANAVIHTVKHDLGIGDDREVTPETQAFDRLVTCIVNESELRGLDRRTKKKGPLSLSPSYRHFDDLIWRTPAWASGLFTLAVLSLDSEKLKFATGLTGLPTSAISSGFLLLTCFVLLGFSFALYRFRFHQLATRLPNRERTPMWRSASSLFHLLINAEAFAFGFLAMMALGVPYAYSAISCAFGTIGLTLVEALSLRAHAIEKWQPKAKM